MLKHLVLSRQDNITQVYVCFNVINARIGFFYFLFSVDFLSLLLWFYSLYLKMKVLRFNGCMLVIEKECMFYRLKSSGDLHNLECQM